MHDKQVITNLFWKFAERFSAQIVSLLVSIVLSRLLLPEDYGVVSLALVFITFADVFVVNGLGNSLIQKGNPDDLDYSSVFWVNIVLSVLLYSVLYFSAPSISKFYGYDEITLIIRVFALRLIVAGVNSIQHAYVSKTMQFKKYFWSTLFGTVLSGVIGVTLAYLGYGVWALVSQYMLNSIVDTIVLAFTVDWRPKFVFSYKRIVPLVSYGWKILFESVSNTATTQLRNLLIGKVYTSGDLAYYTKGQQFPSLLINNISVSISSVLFPAMSNINEITDDVKKLMRKSVRYSSYILFPLLAGFAMISEPFIEFILTDKWLQAAPYMKIFCFIMILEIGMYPRHEALKSIGRSDVYMNEHIIYRVIDIVVLIAFMKKGVISILYSHLFCVAFLSIIIVYTSYKYTNYGIKEQIGDIFYPLILTIIMCAMIYPLGNMDLLPLIKLICQIMLGSMVYILFSYIFKVNEFMFFINSMKCLKRGGH